MAVDDAHAGHAVDALEFGDELDRLEFVGIGHGEEGRLDFGIFIEFDVEVVDRAIAFLRDFEQTTDHGESGFAEMESNGAW